MKSDAPLVFVVDDDPSVCLSTKRVLEPEGFAVRTFLSPEGLFAHGRPNGPCCLVLDVHLDGNDGISYYERLTQSGMFVPAVFITAFGNIPMSVRAMKLGAVDFLSKPYDPEQLVACVLNALERDEQALATQRRDAQLRKRYHLLTARQREIFVDVTSGMLNKQVAFERRITERTVKLHRARVMQRMEAHSFAELVGMARDLDLQVNTSPIAPT
jgi:FixJ family two-component response regulator